MSYYIGLLSGTSVDGIDAAIISIDEQHIKVIETHAQSFSHELSDNLKKIISEQKINLAQLSDNDSLLAFEFSQAVDILINKSAIDKKDIIAIGSHGQTIYHQPNGNHHNTWQIGSPHMIAANTGIKVVSHFRNMDMAYGGQGAPLAPLIHQKLFAKTDSNTAVINLGGIANISFIGKDYEQPIGYDTGPANCLMDEWINIHQQKPYDDNGQWAQQGDVNQQLLKEMLADQYFQKPYPKSTGREYFNHRWYDNFIGEFKNTSAVDIQATLCHLTATSITQSIDAQSHGIDEIILMGGGAKNTHLKQLIEKTSKTTVNTADHYGFDGDWIEAVLFAYLAYQRINEKPVNLGSFTGASRAVLAGDIVQPI